MLPDAVKAVRGVRPFDLLIRDIQIVNVFNASITRGCIGIVGERIAYVGEEAGDLTAVRTIEGRGRYALPGFVDSHMHLESSMLTPPHFAETVLSCGTTTVAADPHEIANVMGAEGVKALLDAAKGLSLRVLMMAPSTIPSAPGFEDSGYAVGAAEAGQLLDLPGVCGLGEVMDFNGVADGDEHILSVIETAVRRGCIVDGHASLLTGRRLQAFRAAGIDSDHTLGTAEKLREELALGFTVQVQGAMLSEELARAMNDAPVQERICLVTDDVPLPRLMREGHLNHVVAKAIALGLDPIRAIRFATINPAVRLRLYNVGGLAPGMTADIQLTESIERPHAETVLFAGKPVVEEGALCRRFPVYAPQGAIRETVRIEPVREEDFAVTVPVPAGFRGGTGLANLIHEDGVSFRTVREQRPLPLSAEKNGRAFADTGALLKMAVFDRYGRNRHSLALIGGMDGVSGAAALTYGHDSHNLSVFGGNDRDMTAAANAVIGAGGGICAAKNGRAEVLIPLPLAGLLSEEEPQALLRQLEAFLEHCRSAGFSHADLMSFFTIMPLAVSPEIKCTNRGLVDVVHKCFLPLIEQIREDEGHDA